MSKNLVQIILSDDLRNLKHCMFRSIKILTAQHKKKVFFIELCCFYERECQSKMKNIPLTFLPLSHAHGFDFRGNSLF